MIGSEELIKYIFNYSLVHEIGLGIHKVKIILKIGINISYTRPLIRKVYVRRHKNRDKDRDTNPAVTNSQSS